MYDGLYTCVGISNVSRPHGTELQRLYVLDSNHVSESISCHIH